MHPVRFALSLLLLAAAPVHAQYRGPDPKVSVERLARFSHLVGTWEGQGWAMERAGKAEFTSTETVTRELDGALFMVRGVHRDAKDSAHIMHNAIGLIAYDQPQQRYSFQTYLATGSMGGFVITPTDKGFDWSINTPAIKMRYSATITADRWIEQGERSMDGGKSWTPFFAMELTKVR